MLSLLLLDAQRLLLEGLAALLDRETDLRVLAIAGTVPEALQTAREDPPDLVVLDPQLPGEDGLRLLPELEALEVTPRTLALASSDDPQLLRRALAAGVDSYVLKRARYHEVVSAIRQTAAGETVISPEFVYRLVDQPAPSVVVAPI